MPHKLAYTYNENTTDSTIIIDAMDPCYAHRFDSSLLVLVNSNFNRLLARISEALLAVDGVWKRKMPYYECFKPGLSVEEDGLTLQSLEQSRLGSSF